MWSFWRLQLVSFQFTILKVPSHPETKPNLRFHGSTSWPGSEQLSDQSHAALLHSSALLLPKVFVGINAEVIFITDGELLLCLLCFSLFLPRLPLSFRQSSQVNGHLVNTGKTVSGQRCEVYQRNKQECIFLIRSMAESSWKYPLGRNQQLV